MSACHYIDVRSGDSRGEGSALPLRSVCAQMLERASSDGSVERWYKEDKLPQIVGLRGRAWSGIPQEEMTDVEEAQLARLRCSRGYDATRSCFTYRKEVKELLRGGFEQDANFRDYDLKASFPRAFAARHPDATSVRSWVDGSFDLCGMSRDVAKSFINQCFGVGEKGIADWCRQHGYGELPIPLQRYLADVREGSRRDVANNPAVVEKLRAAGRFDRDLQNGVVYVLNTAHERELLEEGAERVRRLARVRCFELDGFFLERLDASWDEVEAALGPHFAHKPYRHRASLLKGLMSPHESHIHMSPEGSYRHGGATRPGLKSGRPRAQAGG
ncbi:unnamed protein product [Symbiodinium natans]|uniref:Uncharacterized protein n=1 Tax=Symbiodinium natans TaxID=878477 RepID=A0A812HBY9_9DINO|nr:unnamed protein product [Symbiodinium natans]